MMRRYALAAAVLASSMAVAVSCGGGEPAAPGEGTSPQAAAPAEEEDEPLPPSVLETALPAGVRENVLKPFTGDFKEMIERRVVRVGVPFNRTLYFVDKGVQRGVAYDYGVLMEQKINEKVGSGNIKVHVFFVPQARENLLPALVDGHVDLVVGHLTITPERQAFVDFSDPTRSNVNEIVVTGPGSPAIDSVEALSGQRVFVRRESSYHASLQALNTKLEAAGKPPVGIEFTPPNLEDDDLLEMVNAGLIPAIVVDDYLAKFWKKVFPDLVLHENVAVRSGGNLGVAMRKNSPELRTALNNFLGKYGIGSAFGNTIERRYLQNTTYVRNAASDAERKKFMALVELFRKYSDQYTMDYLLMAAQGYQESRLDQDAKSHVGAIGVMQIMPATGAELKVGDIAEIEPNVHGGVKYMRQLIDRYFKDEPMDQLNRGLFAFAAYNAGPGRVRQLRREAEKRGLDPNVWFGNVEQIASERIGRETVTYVSNIYKYYVAYRLVMEENERRAAARSAIRGGGPPRQ